MAVGPRDAIDKKLINMYADKQTNSFDSTSRLDPEKVWQSMALVAINNRNFIQVKGLNSKKAG